MLSDVAKPTHLFRVLEVLEEGLLVPGDTLVHVGSGVGEAIGLTGLTAEDTARRQLHQPLPHLTRARASRLTHGGWGRPCEAHPHQQYGIGRSGS